MDEDILLHVLFGNGDGKYWFSDYNGYLVIDENEFEIYDFNIDEVNGLTFKAVEGTFRIEDLKFWETSHTFKKAKIKITNIKKETRYMDKVTIVSVNTVTKNCKFMAVI